MPIKGRIETKIPEAQIVAIMEFIWWLESLPALVIGVHMACCRSKTMQVIVQISVTPANVPKPPNAKQPLSQKYIIKAKNLQLGLAK